MARLTQVFICITLIFMASAWPFLKTSRRSDFTSDCPQQLDNAKCQECEEAEISSLDTCKLYHKVKGKCSDRCTEDTDDNCFDGCMDKAGECYVISMNLHDEDAVEKCEKYHEEKWILHEIITASKEHFEKCLEGGKTKKQCDEELKKDKKVVDASKKLFAKCLEGGMTVKQCEDEFKKIEEAEDEIKKAFGVCVEYGIEDQDCIHGIAMCLANPDLEEKTVEKCKEMHGLDDDDKRRLASKRDFKQWVRRLLQRKKK